MSAKNACMSAFPCEQHETQEGNWNQTFEPGMTLRDYFAAAALQGWLASYGDEVSHPVSQGYANMVAAQAYAMADEMMKEREK